MALFGFGGKKTTVGLDIGSGLIKMCVVSHAGGEPTLTKVAFATVSDDAIVEGEVIDAGVVADAVRELLASNGVKTKDAVIAIGGRDVIIKKISMDRMSEDDAREVIRWEAEQHVPFDMENVELDFQILDPDGEGLQMTVLLVAAKRELIEGRIGLLNEAGLDAKIIDVDAFALHNAFELNHPDEMSGIIALVNIGHETTNINILEDGIPVLTRDMPLGTRRLREDLQRERGISVEEAEQMIRGGERNELLDPFVASRGDELATGIERAAAFLQSSSRSGGQINRLYLVGGGARVPGLAKVLADRLRVKVELANPLGRLAVAEGVFDDMNMDEVAPLLMLPIGLALRTAA
jgi:type IV pilus assembly protein PilM